MKMTFFGEEDKEDILQCVYLCNIIGLVVGAVISSVTEYYTGLGKKPILKIVQQSVLEQEQILLQV